MLNAGGGTNWTQSFSLKKQLQTTSCQQNTALTTSMSQNITMAPTRDVWEITDKKWRFTSCDQCAGCGEMSSRKDLSDFHKNQKWCPDDYGVHLLIHNLYTRDLHYYCTAERWADLSQGQGRGEGGQKHRNWKKLEKKRNMKMDLTASACCYCDISLSYWESRGVWSCHVSITVSSHLVLLYTYVGTFRSVW